ncbi:hypothetical protein D3C75_732160 [compost metagenome]
MQEIQPDLAHQVFIRRNLHLIRLQIHIDILGLPLGLTSQNKRNKLLIKPVGSGMCRCLRRIQHRQLHEIVAELGQAEAFRFDNIQITLPLLRVQSAAFERFGKAHNGGQRRPDFMGDIGDKLLAQRFHLLQIGRHVVDAGHQLRKGMPLPLMPAHLPQHRSQVHLEVPPGYPAHNLNKLGKQLMLIRAQERADYGNGHTEQDKSQHGIDEKSQQPVGLPAYFVIKRICGHVHSCPAQQQKGNHHQHIHGNVKKTRPVSHGWTTSSR